ncbi:hypothetical protein SNK04_014003 [Fusarium graminearum]
MGGLPGRRQAHDPHPGPKRPEDQEGQQSMGSSARANCGDHRGPGPAGVAYLPYKADSIGASFRRACNRLQIEDLHFHDLRHEGTSRLFEQGYTIPEVAIVTGHRDWKSLKRYTQLAPASLHRPESNLTRPLEDVYKPGPPSKGR